MRRYIKGRENLINFTSLSDYWMVIDNSLGMMRFVAEGNMDEEIAIFEQESWWKIKFTR